MRRSERAVTDLTRQLEILDQCKILRLGLQDQDGMFIVPVNFGYVQQNEKLSLYVHSAKEGRKAAAMTPGCTVALEADCSMELIPADIACKYSCKYRSLMGTGQAVLVTDPAEKAAGLSAIMVHQTGQAFSFTAQMTEAVAVFRIDVTALCGKQRQ